MSKQKVQLILATVVLFLVSSAVTILFVREILQQSQLLQKQISELQRDQAQQTRLSQIKRLVEDTAADRQQIYAHYLQSQSDSIDFLNYVETLAAKAGVELQTNRATEIERDNAQLLAVDYTISGSQLGVEGFIKMLEIIPFVSEVPSMQLSKRTAVVWEATATIEVFILDYEATN